jgi:hypothetical protein
MLSSTRGWGVPGPDHKSSSPRAPCSLFGRGQLPLWFPLFVVSRDQQLAGGRAAHDSQRPSIPPASGSMRPSPWRPPSCSPSHGSCSSGLRATRRPTWRRWGSSRPSASP